MNSDTILWLTGIAAEAIVVLLCMRRRLFRSMPVFSLYVVWSLLVDLGFYYARHVLSPHQFLKAYIIELIADSAFQFAVLVELGWSVLKPLRASLPRHSLLMLTGINLLAGLAVWPIASWTLPRQLTSTEHLYVHSVQAVAALRVVIFVFLAGFSRLLSIGWRNRELQIATGLGIYSIVRLAVSLLQTHAALNDQFHGLEVLVVASYDCSLAYWIFAFAQKEAERQEFSPRMESFLLSVAGAARTSRVAVANSTAGGPSKGSRA